MTLDKPIVLITGFKAGTWMMRKTVNLLTNLEFYEPEIIPGEKKYYDHTRLHFIKNRFYSWHLIPTQKSIDKLNNNNAKTIFVIRNIYDIVLSIYYYFYNNIDADIGRANNKDVFLKKFTFDQGISLIISGFDENGLRWNGMAEIVDHYNHIFLAHMKTDSIIISYEELVEENFKTLKYISKFLKLNTSDTEFNKISNLTTFQSMKNEAKKKGVGELHFRAGKVGFNRDQLNEYHKVHLRQIIKIHAPNIYENAKKLGFSYILEE